MITDTQTFVTATRQSLREAESSRRLAAGVVFGMLIGIVPKDSLLVWLIGVLTMMTTANLASAFTSCLAFTWTGMLLDSLTHKLGGLVLTAEKLEPVWARLYDLPVVPWTRFNNTVVMGSLLLGMFLVIPVYCLSHRFFQTWGAAIHQRLRTMWIYRWLVAPVASPSIENRP